MSEIVDGPDIQTANVVWQLLREHHDCIDQCDLYLGRHGQQVESLSRQVLLHGPFAHIVEVGAGKGLLGRVPRLAVASRRPFGLLRFYLLHL